MKDNKNNNWRNTNHCTRGVNKGKFIKKANIKKKKNEKKERLIKVTIFLYIIITKVL